MSPVFRAIVLFAVAAVLCAATFILVPHLRSRTVGSGGFEPDGEEELLEDETEADVPRARSTDPSADVSSRPERFERRTLGALSKREKAKFDVGEMRHEAEDMLRRFRGSEEERQAVIEECEDGKALILLIAELSESSIEGMSPEELEKERESFEKDYRAQLDFLQTGQLQRQLKTPDEREIIGSTYDAVQGFLERIDEALHSAGY